VRIGDLAADRFGSLCAPEAAHATGGAADAILLSANAGCTPTPWTVTEGARYRLSFAVIEPWTDGPPDLGWLKPKAIAADPVGFKAGSLPFYARFGGLILRVPDGRWLQPLAMVRAHHGWNGMLLLPVRRARLDGRLYVAEFTAPRTGPLSLSVNDIVLPWKASDRQPFYRHNSGTATVRLQKISR
jgi:hypothetical protein